MNTVTLSKRFGGTRATDTWHVGDDVDHAGASPLEYVLPDGWRLSDDEIIDRYGFRVNIYTHPCGRPQLISVSGPERSMPVLAIAATTATNGD